MMYYNASTGELTDTAPWGNHYYDDELKKKMFAGWQEVADNFLPPATEPTKAEKCTALDNEYQPQFNTLAQSLSLAVLSNDADAQASIKSDYTALKTEYTNKKEVIENGNS
ncbi:hypothetical protein [Pectinatus frisingensis]|uniref:hypothetical protein n=1 Tax=Pectinatus frisingensis TaxID=865 RepID=UPI0018C47373|nr:hypothetical protein [Pectinatus frisingensis]